MSALSDITGALTNPYGTPSTGEWNLARGVYTTKDTNQSMVIFFEKADKDEPKTKKTAVDQISDSGGRRIVSYEYAYQDGQQLADLGKKGETFVWNITFFGLNYQDKLNEFIRIVQDTAEAATIVHPIRGAKSVRFSNWEYIHRHDQWNAVTIRATFLEDNTYEIQQVNKQTTSPDSSLRSALQSLSNFQATISQDIFSVGALLLLPSAIQNAMNTRLNSIVGQISGLLGQLAATFSTDSKLKSLAAQSSTVNGGVTQLSAGTVAVSGSTTQAQLPPVFQVGFDPTTQSFISSQTSSFVSANQITPQQAVFAANSARQAIAAAINEVNTNFGNQGYDVMVQYRGLAVSIQEAVEASISTSQLLVKLYTVPNPMSLRQIAKNNGLTYTRQNDIEALNPYLPSVNYVPKGYVITVPAS